MSESKNKLINYAQIHWSDQSEPISGQFNDVYFNTEQGLSESLYVFIQGNDLEERWLNCEADHFSIAETGFGTGLNFLNTCREFHRFREKHPDAPLKRMHFSSFEKYPLSKADLTTAQQRWPQLSDYIAPLLAQYPQPLPGCHRIVFDAFNITLDLWFGDVLETLPSLYIHDAGLFDCWYLDGFAPSKNPEMWSDQLFQHIAKSCKNNATIATFSAAGFVRRGLICAGFTMQKRKGYAKKREMLIGRLSNDRIQPQQYGPYFRPAAQTPAKEIAIIGGGIASACLSLALIKRGYKVTLYCKNASLAEGASGNQQGALYPLINGSHDHLSCFFANSFLYARNYVHQINQSHPFDFDFSGLLQLYYDQSATNKLDKILQADFPDEFVCKISAEQTNTLAQLDIGQPALYYPQAGWLNPQQMVNAIFQKAQDTQQLTIHLNAHIHSLSETADGWTLHLADKQKSHPLLVLTTAMNTLDFSQAKAVPVSAARGQVTHIPSTEKLEKLRLTLCHEGYLTPASNGKHCMGATFKRHQLDTAFSPQEQQDNKLKLQKCIPDKTWTEQIECMHDDANVGIRCTTRDHFPYVGALADYEKTKIHYQQATKEINKDNPPFHHNLFLLTGLGSRGLCTAPLLAELLAGQIEQEPLPFSRTILNALQTNRQWVNYLKKGKKLKI